MPLVNAKCTNCGANLTVDETKDAAVCQYCGSAFIVEKAINNYNTTINAGVVKIYNTVSEYEIVAGELMGYNGKSLNPVIPEGVIKINKKAFKGKMISSVTMPDSVLYLDDWAFAECPALTSVKFSKNLKEISGYAFFMCSGLEKIELPSNIEGIKEYAFSQCSNLSEVKFNDGLRYIEKHAFSECPKIKEIILPDTLTGLGNYAFSICTSLENVKLSSKQRGIGESAFSSTKIKQISVPDSVEMIYGSFNECTELVSVKLPKNLKKIGFRAFYGCKKLQKLDIPDTVEVVDGYAFNGCENLQELIIPDKVKYVGIYAFFGCKNLENLSISEEALYHLDTDHYKGTKFMAKIWKKKKLCSYCGGTLTGNIFSKHCLFCGRKKDY